MNVQPAIGINIIQQAYKDPQVQAADQRLERWQKELDQVDLALQAPRDQCFSLQPRLYEQTWKGASEPLAHLMAFPFLLGMAGAVMGVSAAASALPALQPFRGLLTIGALVAGWKLVPRAIGFVVRKAVLPPIVHRHMKRELTFEKQRYESAVRGEKLLRDATVQRVMETLYKKAAEEAAKNPQPSGEVKVEEETVTVNGIKVRKNKAPVAQPSP